MSGNPKPITFYFTGSGADRPIPSTLLEQKFPNIDIDKLTNRQLNSITDQELETAYAGIAKDIVDGRLSMTDVSGFSSPSGSESGNITRAQNRAESVRSIIQLAIEKEVAAHDFPEFEIADQEAIQADVLQAYTVEQNEATATGEIAPYDKKTENNLSQRRVVIELSPNTTFSQVIAIASGNEIEDIGVITQPISGMTSDESPYHENSEIFEEVDIDMSFYFIPGNDRVYTTESLQAACGATSEADLDIYLETNYPSLKEEIKEGLAHNTLVFEKATELAALGYTATSMDINAVSADNPLSQTRAKSLSDVLASGDFYANKGEEFFQGGIVSSGEISDKTGIVVHGNNNFFARIKQNRNARTTSNFEVGTNVAQKDIITVTFRPPYQELSVPFKFNSTVITPKGETVINTAAIMEDAGKKIIAVISDTNANPFDGKNQTLSAARNFNVMSGLEDVIEDDNALRSDINKTAFVGEDGRGASIILIDQEAFDLSQSLQNETLMLTGKTSGVNTTTLNRGR
ncbi:MAG: hypothetical protein ACTSXQ_00100 [Alphaproteobacteria bacterium]